MDKTANNSSTLNSTEPAAEDSPSTLAIHADDFLNCLTDVAPPLHVSTTFRYNGNGDNLVPVHDEELDPSNPTHIYSRLSAPNSTRLESILSALLHGHAITYASGLAAFHAFLVHYRPRVIAITGGYHGCHGVVALLTRLYGLRTVPLTADDATWDEVGLGAGDVVHVETPLNPTGEVQDLAHYAARAKARGALLTVDATFGPPPLQDPFALGADAVMHSGTKFLGGHSDLLCGVLAVRDEKTLKRLFTDRLYLGGVMGSMEAWLAVRSVRTLEVRVRAQSDNATKLALWLQSCLVDDNEAASAVRACVVQVQHASIQALSVADSDWIKKQMPDGYGPVFAIMMRSPSMAQRLPSALRLFHHATSLGGVESLIEWRKMSDPDVDERLLRFSVGLENWKDLQSDIMLAMKTVLDKEGN